MNKILKTTTVSTEKICLTVICCGSEFLFTNTAELYYQVMAIWKLLLVVVSLSTKLSELIWMQKLNAYLLLSEFWFLVHWNLDVFFIDILYVLVFFGYFFVSCLTNYCCNGLLLIIFSLLRGMPKDSCSCDGHNYYSILWIGWWMYLIVTFSVDLEICSPYFSQGKRT